MRWIIMSTVCAGSLFSLCIFAGFSEKILTLDNEKDMDKNKICEALYALPGNVVVKRRKFQLLPAVLFVAGAALIVVNNMYGADLTNNLRSSIVFIGGIMVVAGMIMAAAQMFGSGGAPFHREERCFLLYEELYFDRGIRSDVMQAVSDGDAERGEARK